MSQDFSTKTVKKNDHKINENNPSPKNLQE